MSELSRRNFKRKAGSFALLSASIPVVSTLLSSCEQDEGGLIVNNTEPKDNVFKLSEYPELQNEGGSVKVNIEGENEGYDFIIVRQSNDEFLIVSNKCTHAGCKVAAPSAEGENMKCPCHGAQFSSMDASVKQKPSDNSDISPLETFSYKFDASKQELEIVLNPIV